MAGRKKGMQHIEAPIMGASDVWLTPPHIISALGPFDLDPCAAPSPRPFDTAARYIELPDDGLMLPWYGRVWLNPPYGPLTEKWMMRLALHRRGIALIYARLETQTWFGSVWPYAIAVLFFRGRLTFCDQQGKPGEWNGGAPSALVAFCEEDADALKQSGLSGAYIDLRERVTLI